MGLVTDALVDLLRKQIGTHCTLVWYDHAAASGEVGGAPHANPATIPPPNTPQRTTRPVAHPFYYFRPQIPKPAETALSGALNALTAAGPVATTEGGV